MSWRPLKKVEYIVVHCSATRPDQDIGAEDITRWHRMKGWLDIGYHYVIRRNGVLEEGRSVNVPGAHARGYNHRSIGVCLVGGLDGNSIPNGSYTAEQWEALEGILFYLTETFPKAKVIGHRDLPNVVKACPCFDVLPWWSDVKGDNNNENKDIKKAE